jgi:hypothetical protein
VFVTCVGLLLDRLASLVLHAERAHAMLFGVDTKKLDLEPPTALSPLGEVWTGLKPLAGCPAERKT